MYKFFAVAFYSLPIIFISLYALNSRFFFDHIFIYLLLVGAALYVAFAVYLVGQTFLTVRDDSLLNKLVLKITKLKNMGFIKVAHVTNAIAFVWVTLLFLLTTLVLAGITATFTFKVFGSQITGLVKYASGYEAQDQQLSEDILDLTSDVRFLMSAYVAEKTQIFLNNNKTEVSDVDVDYEYVLNFDPNTAVPPQIKPQYRYYLTLCDIRTEVRNCNFGNSALTTPVAFSLAYDEKIEELHGDIFEFDGKGDSLHRIRLITNQRTLDMMVVFRNHATSFGESSSSYALPSNYSEIYEYKDGSENLKNFEYQKYDNNKLQFTSIKQYYYDPSSGTIKGHY